jgi:hypothetical protein
MYLNDASLRSAPQEPSKSLKNEITNAEFSISLKAYGDGPLQLSTDKNFRMYPMLEKYGDSIEDKTKIDAIFSEDAFSCFSEISVLPLIYDEKNQRCNILVFDAELAKNSTKFIKKKTEGSGRKHPAYAFFDENHQYICEVRYGSATANALQRGLWTNTKRALPYFNSITGGWIDYSHNLVLVKLFSHALVCSLEGHESALEEVRKDISRIKQGSKQDA